jgi:type II secretory pathway component PulK
MVTVCAGLIIKTVTQHLHSRSWQNSIQSTMYLKGCQQTGTQMLMEIKKKTNWA